MDQPKVRFSQASDSVAVHADDEDTVLNKSKGKVKIKSIVPTAYPIKILKSGQRVVLKEQKSNLDINKKSSSASGCSKFHSSTSSIPSIHVSEVNSLSNENECDNVRSPRRISDDKNIKNKDGSLDECIAKLQQLSFECSNNKQNCIRQNTGRIKENDQKSHSSKKNSDKFCLDDEDSDVEVIEVIKNPTLLKCTKANQTPKDNRKENFRKENKENKSIKYNFSKNHQNNNKNKILKDSINPSFDKIKNVPSKKVTKSQNKIQLMPCAKFRQASLSKNKSAEKVKKAEVRKSMVYDVISKHNNVSVEPGTFHKKCSHPVIDIEESSEKKNIASEDLLSRPEYNSTVCVMKKLKKLENEKPNLPDLQHLPQDYKNLIYGKVSAGLDVAPYECIYKDLINISVDDNQLPARLMRSKDPEPRDKDIVPKISDFYQPKYAEQYFTIANPLVPRPVNLNTLSAFTISNKICTWKSARDNF